MKIDQRFKRINQKGSINSVISRFTVRINESLICNVVTIHFNSRSAHGKTESKQYSREKNYLGYILKPNRCPIL